MTEDQSPRWADLWSVDPTFRLTAPLAAVRWCPVCEGAGVMEGEHVPTGQEREQGHRPLRQIVSCPECRGKGAVIDR
jgi:DnaJ-class molecular chaperone